MELLIPQIEGDKDFKFTIEPGERALLLGPNGAGKSRLGAYIESELSKVIEQSDPANASEGTTDQSIAAQIVQKEQEIESLENMKVESLARKIRNHQNSPSHSLIPNSLTRKEILRLLFKGEIYNAKIEYNSITFTESFPPTSLDGIFDGFITIDDVIIDVEFMKVNPESSQSILKFKNRKILSIKKQIKDLNLKDIGFIKINKEKDDNEESIQYCLRISGHRSLIFNQILSIEDSEVARKNLHVDTSNINQKWNGKPTGGLQADFEKLLRALISKEVSASLIFKQDSDSTTRPVTELDKVIGFWNEILLAPKMTSAGLEIKITAQEESYTLDQCSEGEKSIFYIIGQCIIAPERSLIIIDEPEIHINKSILAYLFDKIESIRSDCAFIYITHDIDFSRGRVSSKFYTVKNYTHPNKWAISLTDSYADIPIEIITRIAGTRKPILFCEGKDTSIDNLYKKIYREFTVIPVGGCKDVVNLTNSLNKITVSDFHYHDCYGIIDGDNQYRATDKIKQIKVGQIENLFLLPEIAKILFKIFFEEWPGKEKYSEQVAAWAESNTEWRKKIWRILFGMN